MSDTPNPSSRPRPVVLYGAFTAALGAFLGFAGLTDLMPKTVIAWVALGGAVVTAAGGVIVQSRTTPLSSPRDARGVPMAPIDAFDPTPAPTGPTLGTTGGPLLPD